MVRLFLFLIFSFEIVPSVWANDYLGGGGFAQFTVGTDGTGYVRSATCENNYLSLEDWATLVASAGKVHAVVLHAEGQDWCKDAGPCQVKYTLAIPENTTAFVEASANLSMNGVGGQAVGGAYCSINNRTVIRASPSAPNPATYVGVLEAGKTYDLYVQTDVSSVNGTAETANMTISFTSTVAQQITLAATSAEICEGQSVSFTVTPAGAGAGDYVWSLDGTTISGVTGASCSVAPEEGSHTLSVYRKAYGDYSQSNTATAVLTVDHCQGKISARAVPAYGTSYEIWFNPSGLTPKEVEVAPCSP
jgi:hypothetical protein